MNSVRLLDCFEIMYTKCLSCSLIPRNPVNRSHYYVKPFERILFNCNVREYLLEN